MHKTSSAPTTHSQAQLSRLHQSRASELIFKNLTLEDQVMLISCFKKLMKNRLKLGQGVVTPTLEIKTKDQGMPSLLQKLEIYKSVSLQKNSSNLIIRSPNDSASLAHADRVWTNEHLIVVKNESKRHSLESIAVGSGDLLKRLHSPSTRSPVKPVKAETRPDKIVSKSESGSSVTSTAHGSDLQTVSTRVERECHWVFNTTITASKTRIYRCQPRPETRSSLCRSKTLLQAGQHDKFGEGPDGLDPEGPRPAQPKSDSKCKSESKNRHRRVTPEGLRQETTTRSVQTNENPTNRPKPRSKPQRESSSKPDSEKQRFAFVSLEVRAKEFTLKLKKLRPHKIRLRATTLAAKNSKRRVSRARLAKQIHLDTFDVDDLKSDFYRAARTFRPEHTDFLTACALFSRPKLRAVLDAYNAGALDSKQTSFDSLEFYRVNAICRETLGRRSQVGLTLFEVYLFLRVHSGRPVGPKTPLPRALSDLFADYLGFTHKKVQFYDWQIRKLMVNTPKAGQLATLVETRLKGLSQCFLYSLVKNWLRVFNLRGLGVIRCSFAVDVFLFNLSRVLGAGRFVTHPSLVCALSKRLCSGAKVTAPELKNLLRTWDARSRQRSRLEMLSSAGYRTELARFEALITRACSVEELFSNRVWDKFVVWNLPLEFGLGTKDGCKNNSRKHIKRKRSGQSNRESLAKVTTRQTSNDGVRKRDKRCTSTGGGFRQELLEFVRRNKHQLIRDLFCDTRRELTRTELDRLARTIKDESLARSIQAVTGSQSVLFKSEAASRLAEFVLECSKRAWKSQTVTKRTINNFLGKRQFLFE